MWPTLNTVDDTVRNLLWLPVFRMIVAERRRCRTIRIEPVFGAVLILWLVDFGFIFNVHGEGCSSPASSLPSSDHLFPLMLNLYSGPK